MTADDLSADVLSASAAWISRWTPPGAVSGVVDGDEFYCAGGVLVLVDSADVSSARDLVARLRLLARRRDCSRVELTVGPGLLGDVALEEILALGGSVTGRVDIVALPTDPPTEIAVPPDVSLREVANRVDVEDYLRTSHEAWGYPSPTADDVHRFWTELEPGSFVARVDGVDAGAGGYSLVDGAARFWGAAVVPAYRRRGVYRGLVAARVDHARDRGARLALVHAAPTSSPILQAIGFRVHGRRTTVSIDA